MVKIQFKDRNAKVYKAAFPNIDAARERFFALKALVAESARHCHYGPTDFLYDAEADAIRSALLAINPAAAPAAPVGAL